MAFAALVSLTAATAAQAGAVVTFDFRRAEGLLSIGPNAPIQGDIPGATLFVSDHTNASTGGGDGPVFVDPEGMGPAATACVNIQDPALTTTCGFFAGAAIGSTKPYGSQVIIGFTHDVQLLSATFLARSPLNSVLLWTPDNGEFSAGYYSPDIISPEPWTKNWSGLHADTSYQISAEGQDGGGWSLVSLTFLDPTLSAPVPEPGSLPLALGALFGLAVLRTTAWRKR